MISWCYTDYVFEGNEKTLDDFEYRLKLSISACEGSTENEFGNFWLGNIAMEFGFPYKNDQFNVKGNISNIIRTDDDVLRVTTQTAFKPFPEMWDAIFDRHYRDEEGNIAINYVFVSEEIGKELFVNTDLDGKHFTVHYALMIHDDDNYDIDDCYYMDDEEDIILTLKTYFDIEEISSFEEALKIIDEINNDQANRSIINLIEYQTEW